MERNQFSRFSEVLRRLGPTGVGVPEFDVGSDGRHRLRYIPFEHVNRDARLVIVGITPGSTQIDLAYKAAQKLLQEGCQEAEILLEVKKEGAFGGPSMKPNLLKILRHFQFGKLLGIDDVGFLWSKNAILLHSTSVVPHAAFTIGKSKENMFAGSFADIMGSELLRECFEDCFVPSVREMNVEAMFVGLGPCPQMALEWCVKQGYLRNEQVLGSFCHPSTTGGSTTKYYLREVSRSDLKPEDPVRYRCDWLDQAYEQMSASTTARGAGPGNEKSQASKTTAPPVASKTIVKKAVVSATKPAARARNDDIGAIFKELSGADYELTNENQKLGEFKCPSGQAIYVVKTTSHLNRINMMAHPDLKPEVLEGLDGVESVSGEHYFHSNMPHFRKRLNKGKTETTYGWLVTLGSLGDLSRFLTALKRVRL